MNTILISQFVFYKIIQIEDKSITVIKKEEWLHKNHIPEEERKNQNLKHQMIFDHQQRDIQVSLVEIFLS